jgi:hypothetical protein
VLRLTPNSLSQEASFENIIMTRIAQNHCGAVLTDIQKALNTGELAGI